MLRGSRSVRGVTRKHQKSCARCESCFELSPGNTNMEEEGERGTPPRLPLHNPQPHDDTRRQTRRILFHMAGTRTQHELDRRGRKVLGTSGEGKRTSGTRTRRAEPHAHRESNRTRITSHQLWIKRRIAGSVFLVGDALVWCFFM